MFMIWKHQESTVVSKNQSNSVGTQDFKQDCYSKNFLGCVCVCDDGLPAVSITVAALDG